MIRIFSGTNSVPLENAYASFELIAGNSSDLPFGHTDVDGFAVLSDPIPAPTGGMQLFVTAPEHQTLIIPHEAQDYEIVLPRIHVPSERLGWWHQRCGVRESTRLDGRNIRIGIVDSGCHSAPSLKHIKDLGTISLTGHDRTDRGCDDDQHGTSVAALIAGRPGNAEEFIGLAPQAELFSIRVTFEHSPAESNQTLIADALELILEQNVHLINCSFAFTQEHADVQRYLDVAWETGTLIVCAAGNHVPRVGYPARWKNAVSVSALGELKQYHEQSDSALTVPDATLTHRWDKPLFVPNFVPLRGKVDCIAPGVGVIAVEPPHARLPFGNRQKSGTSFAAPIVTGLLASVLSRDEQYKHLPASATRSVYAKQTLDKLCKPLRFDPALQGKGLPRML